MDTAFFDNAPPRLGTNCYKWDSLRESYKTEGLLPFWVADMEFGTLPQIKAALQERIDKPVYGYTFAGPEYFQSITEWYRVRHHVQIEREEIIPLPGVVMGVGHILNVFTGKGDRVIINTPVYDSFADLISRMGRVVADAPLLKEGESYTLDFEKIESRLQEGAKAYVFCSPHNPVGRVWKKEEVEHVVRLCCKYRVPLIADEIHSDLVFAGHRHYPAFSASKEAEKCVILLNSPSKTFNIASLKSAYIITKNPEFGKKIREEIHMYHMGVCFLGYLSTEIAYFQGAEWVDALTGYLEGNARFAYEYLQDRLPRIKTYVPDGTFLMWLDFTNYGMSQEELMNFLVKRAGLVLNSGTDYGAQYEGFARFNIGAPRSFVKKGLERLAEAMESNKI